MTKGYLDIRDKTFIMHACMEAEQQQAYALSLREYMEDPDAYDEMVKYTGMFNTEEDLLAFMDEHVEDRNVVHYDHRLDPSLIEARTAVDELHVSTSRGDQIKARNLALFLLADMKDDLGWRDAQNSQVLEHGNSGRHSYKQGESGPDEPSNGYEMV